MRKPYRPSNGSEGMDFMSYFCERCVRDQAYQRSDGEQEGCPIAAAAFAYEVSDPEYPREWIADEQGPRCTAFEAVE